MEEFAKALFSDRLNPAIPEEKDYFGVLIGTWDFVWTDNFGPEGTRRVPGEWIFERVLDGTAVQDLFICPSRAERTRNPQPDAEYGTTLRIYNPASGAWDIFYGCTGTARQLEARREGDRIVLTEITEKRIRFIFSEITRDTFHWERIETEDGSSWRKVGDVRAVRKK